MGTSTSNLNKKVYIAVSSDYRELYKSDVFRVMAKPIGSIEHFRYDSKWILDGDECVNENILLQKKVVLVFKHVPKGQGDEPIFIPIRVGEIIGFEFDSQTKMYHYFFKLNEFCKISSEISYEKDKFFYLKEDIIIDKDIWKNKVLDLKTYFNNVIFYNIVGLTNDNNDFLEICHDINNQSYWYNFVHGENYTLILIISNINEINGSITIKSSSSDVDVILSEFYHVSAPFDNLKIPITTKSLDVRKERSFLSFYINDEENKPVKEYENHLHIIKKMSLIRPFLFGLLTSFLIACTWLIKDRVSSIENIFTWNWDIDYILMIYILIIISSSGFLYFIFNKK